MYMAAKRIHVAVLYVRIYIANTKLLVLTFLCWMGGRRKEWKEPDIICIVETWLDNNIQDNELFLSNYQLFRLD